MKFVVKKIISSLVLPTGLFILVFLAGGLLLFRKRRKLASLLLVSGCVLYLLSTNMVSGLLLAPLESPPKAQGAFHGDVIIVLGAGIEDNYQLDGDILAGLSAASVQRLMCAYFIWNTNKIPIIVSGGALSAEAVPEAVASKRFFIALGVPSEMIIEEGRSLDTRDNVFYSKRIMEDRKFQKPVVVTSAYHSFRSGLLFNQAGIPHVLCPCGAARGDRHWSLLNLLPDTGNFARSTLAIKEYFGIVFYYLFPASQ